MTVRGGGVPLSPMAAMPALRMGPPPRSFAADAHACIMVRVTTTHRIQGCGASSSCPDSELPSDVLSRPQQACRRARGCQGAAGNDGDAARAERRPALTAPARAGLQHVWVGAKKRDSKSNKETGMKEVENAREIVLDSESPIQGRETRRPAGGAADQVRVRHQPADRAHARHRGAANSARHRR